MEPFSAHLRPSILQKCQDESVDLIIVGGGVTGAGAFFEAARRGLKPLLLEQHDFASGTSSSSSKLIHGGLRYIEMMDLGLVFESSRERKRLLQMAPNLVHPLEFLFPVYKHQRRNLFTIYIGTWIYYFLSIFRNMGRPRKCTPDQTTKLVPKLNRRELVGSVRYFDASTIDSRLTLSAIKTGWNLGGLACNHAKVVEYIIEQNRVCGVVVQDQITKKQYQIRAKWIINAVRPWTDPIRNEVLHQSGETLRITKGVHIIAEGNPFAIQTAIVMLSPIDGRVVFMIPWCGHTLIGTTDTDFHGSPDQLKVDSDDIQYLTKTVHYFFPTVALSSNNILSSFAGLRCLKHQTAVHPSDVSREHVLFSEQPGLLTVAGGKLTTFVSMGEEIMEWIVSHTPEWKALPKTSVSVFQDVIPFSEFKNLSEKIFNDLIDHEMAASVQDLLKYRTLSYFFSKDHGASLIEMASRAIKTKLGFSDEEISRQVDEYKKDIKKQYV